MLATDTGVAVRIAEFADTPLLISNANMALMTTDETNSNLCVLVIDNNEVSVLPITTDSVPVCTLQSHDGSTHILYESSHSAAACTSGSQNDISFCPMKAIKPGCKKVYGRCNFCIFCKKCLRGKISQHLLNVHKQEPSVTEINLLPKGSAKRRQLIAKLTNEGNFNHNATVLKSGKGHVVTAWRSRKNTTKVQNVMQYIPCEYCKKFYRKDNVCCDEDGTVRHHGIASGRALLTSALLEENGTDVADLLMRMRDDSVKQTVIQDSLICRFAHLRMEALGPKEYQKLGDVHRGQAARTLARLVQEARKTSQDELITPEKFDLVVQTAKFMTIEKKEPALNLARVIGHLLRHVTMIKSGQPLRENDKVKQKEAADFRKIIDAEWNYRVDAVAPKQLSAKKTMQVQIIPLTEDLLKVRSYIASSMKEYELKVKQDPVPADWSQLAKLTMTRLIMFNKRRRAEVKDLTVKQYTERPK